MADSGIRVSVIVPLYNKGTTVLRTLASIAAQTFRDFEVIVVDDGSRDRGPELVESFPDPRFRLIRQANGGPGSARNHGLQESRGEFVAFLDADDEWLPGYLEHAIGILEAPHRPAAVACGWFDEPGHVQGPSFRDRITAGPLCVSAEHSPIQLVEWLIMFSPCSTVARREIVLKYGGFYSRNNCRYGEDAHLWLKVLLAEPAHLSLEPNAIFHRENSGLSANLPGMRPLEPFLTDPEDVRRQCPTPLRPLLELFLAYRAQKTACLLAYWGEGARARQLVRSFPVPGAWRLPWFAPSLLATTVPGLVGAAASLWRKVRKR